MEIAIHSKPTKLMAKEAERQTVKGNRRKWIPQLLQGKIGKEAQKLFEAHSSTHSLFIFSSMKLFFVYGTSKLCKYEYGNDNLNHSLQKVKWPPTTISFSSDSRDADDWWAMMLTSKFHWIMQILPKFLMNTNYAACFVCPVIKVGGFSFLGPIS